MRVVGSVSILISLGLAACGPAGGPASGTALADATWNSPIFAREALLRYKPADRAYVMGHATGIRLYGQTLPRYLRHTGFVYAPGVSSPYARVHYALHDVLRAPTGGVDGRGRGIDRTASGIQALSASDCVLDTAGMESCTSAPQPETPAEPESPTPADEPNTDGGDRPDPWLDEDCETFLDPAAEEARAMSESVDADALMAEAFEPNEARRQEGQFQRGMEDALHLEDLDEDTDCSEVEHLKEHVQDSGMCEHSPLVLDLLDNGVRISGLTDGVRFDLLQTGSSIPTAWPTGSDDALLVYDRDGDGQIRDGGELFGDSLLSGGQRHDHGFASLARFDAEAHGGNADGVVDAKDELFLKLALWIDADHNGKSNPDELHTLSAMGVVALPLAYESSTVRDRHGNAFKQWGRFRLADGTRSDLIDVWFQTRVVEIKTEALSAIEPERQ